MKANLTSVEAARARVAAAIDSFNESTWLNMRIPQSLLNEIKTNFTKSTCELEPA
jgi:hypothetical protein